MKALADVYRRSRVLVKQLVGREPRVRLQAHLPLEYHGNAYCGWCIPRDFLSPASVVVDVGLGEDIQFSKSIIDTYGCTVHGFDPTPRAVAYARGLRYENFVLHEFGLGATAGSVRFYLPNNAAHVSGSVVREEHLGREQLDVELVTIRDVLDIVRAPRISLLKLDIEGAEYALIASRDFQELAECIEVVCIEFHHRWKTYRCEATLDAVGILNRLGFRCAWRAAATNEEFMFVNSRSLGS